MKVRFWLVFKHDRQQTRRSTGIAVAALLTLTACGGSNASSSAAHAPAAASRTSSVSAALGDRKFNPTDLASVLTDIPEISSMPQVDHGDSPLELPTTCTRGGPLERFGDSTWIEYEQNDVSGSDVVVELSVTETSAPDQAAKLLNDVRRRIEACKTDPLDNGSTAGQPAPIAVTLPPGATGLIANQFNGSPSIWQDVIITSGRVVLRIFLHKYDNATSTWQSPDPAATNQIAQQLFAHYASIYATAPRPV